jgi:hypothetical protein
MKKLQSLGRSLSKEELRSIKGGFIDPGTCRYHYYNGPYHIFSDCMSQSSAQSGATQAAQTYGAGYWCCDSCASAWGMGC